MKKPFAISLLVTLLCGWTASAFATRNATFTQTSPTPPGVFDMGTTQTLTFSVGNANTGTNAGERLYAVRFRINSGSTFTGTTVAPAGWTRTSFSTTQVIFTATDWTLAIQTGSSLSFSVDILMRTTTADANSETLRDGRGSFTTDTVFSNGITNAGTQTDSAIGSWQLRSLQVTSFQITDLTNNPVSTILAGQGFKLVMTVKNVSSAIQSTIVSQTSPPTATKTGTVTQGLTSTVNSPNPLTLAAGASGTITFTYTTLATDNGTIFFTAFARNNTSSATSRTATSNTLTVSGGQFIANTTTSKTCVYIGQTFTIGMDLQNTNLYAINNTAPTLSPSAAGIVTLVSGPTPATVSIGASATLTNAFQWTYQVTGGTVGQIFTMNGSASGTAQPPGSGTKTTPVDPTSNITRAGFSPTPSPAQVNADSTNQEVTVTITNAGCAAAQSVSIGIPVGWTYIGDSYSLINSTDESWTVSGAGPIVFSAPAPANQLQLGQSATFSFVLRTPSTVGSSTFPVTVTDATSATASPTASITVNAFKSGTPSPNDTNPAMWKEIFQ
jgi:hypothetical protein